MSPIAPGSSPLGKILVLYGSVAAFAFAAVVLVSIGRPSRIERDTLDRIGNDAQNAETEDALDAAYFRWLRLRDASGHVPRDGVVRARRQIEQMRTAASAEQQKSLALAAISRDGWRWLGPGNIGGRVRALDIDPADPQIMFAGSAGGGIWRTTNGGASWSPVDDFMESLAVSTIVRRPGNPNEMYAGTGEGFQNEDALGGAGIYKSTDRGLTWSRLPATAGFVDSINRLAFSPNGQILLASSDGAGLRRSTDGGATFRTIALPRLNPTAQVVFHPTDSSRALLGFLSSGAVAYTIDGGLTWRLSSGFNATGRVEVAYARSTPSIVWASVEDVNQGSIYRSTDGGVTFSFIRTVGHLAFQGGYDNAIWVNPVDPNHVLAGGVTLSETQDGGNSWRTVGFAMHVDYHAIVGHPGFDNAANRTVFFGNDGGLFKATLDSIDLAAVSLNNNLGVTQFYGGAGIAATGVIVGGTQDNGTLRHRPDQGTIWQQIAGGDGGYTEADPTSADTVFGELKFLRVFRAVGNSVQFIYNGIADADRRANFLAPIVIDPNDPRRMLAGGASLWRTADVLAVNPSWTAVKPSITSGGDYIGAVTIWPPDSNVIWVGYNFGRVFKTANGTAASPTWTEVTTPESVFVSRLLIDPFDRNVVYLASGSFGPQNVRKSVDGGVSWTDATGSGSTGLPNAPVYDLEMDPSDHNTLYAATEVGLFTTEDAGASWRLPHDGPANTRMDGLFWMGSTLVVATHGRGMYAMDAGGSSGTAGITVSPGSVDFGPQAINTTSAARTVTVGNPGTATLTIQSVSTTGAHAVDFAIPSTTCAGASIAPGMTCAVQVTFRPSAIGARSGAIAIASNAPGSPASVPLAGSGSTTTAATIVLWAANVLPADVHGDWERAAGSTAAGGAALRNPDRTRPKVAPAAASPANFFEARFTASSGTPYRLWIRMRAQFESLSNDSVHLQFSDSVTSSGAPAMRIGTSASAELVLQGGAADTSGHHGWGWTDNGWGSPGVPIYFASTGTHTVRVQQREDGAMVDQIVLSPDRYRSSPPGPRDNDATILSPRGGASPPPTETIVLWAANVPLAEVHGDWQRVADATAAGGAALRNPDRARAKIAPALASPANAFDIRFTAAGGTAYRVWVRLRADNDSRSNDSVHLQFSDTVTPSGAPLFRIGTTSSAEFVLQGGPSDTSQHHGWGWTDNGWESPGALIVFASSGTHTVRIQQREDGATVDQIVLSPHTYLSAAPGPRDGDATILAENRGTPPSGTTVLWAANVPQASIHGDWQQIGDSAAAGGAALRSPNLSRAKIAPALAAPLNYFALAFAAKSGIGYRVWVRLRAQNDSLANDSIHVQFSDSVTASGTPALRIGTTSSAEFVLQGGPTDGSQNHAWGWTDNGWGAPGALVYFAASGTHTLRVQQREDGATVDQIVISADIYATSAPGPRDNDTTILPATGGQP